MCADTLGGVQLSSTFVGIVAFLSISSNTWAHGGGLNSDGCHTNRRTGDYHCHRSVSNLQPPSNSYAPPNSVTTFNKAQSSRFLSTRVFANCTHARAAGAAPVRRGEPGYGPHLDRDNDGIGCEPYRGRR